MYIDIHIYIHMYMYICDGHGQCWVVVAAIHINLRFLPKIKCTRVPTERHSSPAEVVLVEG